MRGSLSLILFLYSSVAFSGCKFKNHVRKVYSFSGVTSVALKELGLLQSSLVKGISVFNPIDQKDFKGQRWPGGIFLSPSSFAEFSGGVVFYDESRELAKILDPMSSIQGVQIKTRGTTPLEVNQEILGTFDSFIEGCEKEKKAFVKKGRELSERLLKITPDKRTVIYYLGTFQHSRPPEMLIVNDGIVKWLIDQKKITSYPSPLAYVNWSAKVMNGLPRNSLHIAIDDSESKMIKKIIKSENHYTLTYPGALVPGMTQLEAWLYFEEHYDSL